MILTIAPTSTVYMDGTGMYSVREENKPGILYTLRLWPEDYSSLVNSGVFVAVRI